MTRESGETMHGHSSKFKTESWMAWFLVWKFLRPDRWDNLPTAVLEQPGLYNHLLSFSAGPRVTALLLILNIYLQTRCLVLHWNAVLCHRDEDVPFYAR